MNSAPRPIATPTPPNTPCNIIDCAILCLRVSCTSSTTGSVLQNLQNLLSSGQELRQNTVQHTRDANRITSRANRKGNRTWWQGNWRKNLIATRAGRTAALKFRSSTINARKTSYEAHWLPKAEVKKAEAKTEKNEEVDGSGDKAWTWTVKARLRTAWSALARRARNKGATTAQNGRIGIWKISITV
jgi:hypothetical protein